MADADKESKTEKATAKRRNQEYNQGNIPQVQEVRVAFMLIASIFLFVFTGQALAKNVLSVSSSILGNLTAFQITPDNISYFLNEIIKILGKLAGPVLLVGLGAGVLGSGIQTRFRLTPKALKINFKKLDPIKGAKRLVNKDTLVKLVIDLLKLAAMGIVMWMAIRKIIKDPIFYAEIDIRHVGAFIADTLIFVFIRLAVAMSVIGLISYLWQRHRSNENMKMTKQEVKQERKDQDMSPEVRKARMQLAFRLMQKQMLSDVETADVVVTNPTHYAVALKYERGIDAAPMVLAKGENAFAQRIKAVAAEHGVPVVENKIVARMLYKVAQIGAPIPVEMFQSVAEILAFVYKTHRYYFHKLKSRRAAMKKVKK